MRSALLFISVLAASACGPGIAAAPDPVGSDSSAPEVLAAFDALPQPADRPPYVPAAGDLVASGDLTVPPGFVAERLSPDGAIPHPTSLRFAPDGRLVVASQDGFVASFDVSGTDARDERRLTSDLKLPLGLLFVRDTLYVSDNGTVWRIRGAERVAIVSGIPTFEHSTDAMSLGPDGKIYLGVGSVCNACRDSDPRNATIVRFDADGSNFEVFARGLRNPYGLAFHPADGSLWATDNGRDDLGTEVPDELDLVQQGRHYGYPDCYGRGRGSNCDGTVGAVLELEANAAAGGIAFYDWDSRGALGLTARSFPAEYAQNAFIAEWGSFRRTRGRKVVRVVLAKRDGRYAARAVDFATGFDAPLDLAVGPSDGALYVADHGRGTIYRIRWRG